MSATPIYSNRHLKPEIMPKGLGPVIVYSNDDIGLILKYIILQDEVWSPVR